MKHAYSFGAYHPKAKSSPIQISVFYNSVCVGSQQTRIPYTPFEVSFTSTNPFESICPIWDTCTGLTVNVIHRWYIGLTIISDYVRANQSFVHKAVSSRSLTLQQRDHIVQYRRTIRLY